MEVLTRDAEGTYVHPAGWKIRYTRDGWEVFHPTGRAVARNSTIDIVQEERAKRWGMEIIQSRMR